VGEGGPRQIAFSPDDKFAYVDAEVHKIKVFDVATNALVDEWRYGGRIDEANEMVVDHTGRYLFVVDHSAGGDHADNLIVLRRAGR